MTCSDCKQALIVKHWSGYHANCRGCKVRSVASGPAFFTSIQANAITPAYRGILRQLFGEGWPAAHDDVKAEHQRIASMDKGKK